MQLLLGGGYTLTKLAKKLDPKSFVITATSPEKVSWFQNEGFQAELVTLDTPDLLRALLQKHPEIDTIIDSVPPLSADPTQGVRSVISALEGSAVKRLFYLSTTGVYGYKDGSLVDESSECHPLNPRGQARLDSENLYRSLSNIAVTSFRISGIYGPGRGLGIIFEMM